MVNWIVSSSVLILVIMLLRHFFKGKVSLRMQYALWLLVAVRLLIPFNFGNSILSIENLISKAEEQPRVQEIMELGNMEIPTISYQEAYEKVVEEYEESGNAVAEPDTKELENLEYEVYALMDEISIEELLQKIAFTLWQIGGAVMAGVFFLSNVIFARRVKKSAKRFKTAESKVPVYVSTEVDTPCLFGIFRPRIYITETVAEDETLLRHSLLHEMTHYAHGDSFWSLLRCICLALHWYNPLVWKAASLSKQDAELACDEATLRKLGEKERLDYGETLIQLTCEKRQDLFVAATTMSTGKKSIKERIILIAGKPKVKVYALVLVAIATLAVVGCTFTSGEKVESDVAKGSDEVSVEMEEGTANGSEEENVPTASSDAAEMPNEQPDTGNNKENLPEQARPFSSQMEKDKVCLAIMLDGISKAGGDYRYIIPDDQDGWLAAYEEMKSRGVLLERPANNVRSQGIWICYNDEWTEITEQGFIVDWKNGVEKADAEDFYNLCVEEAKRYGSGEPVRPEEISGIVSARLEMDDELEIWRITEQDFLRRLENSLSGAEELRGGAACPFTANLTLEWADGRVETIYLATDNCPVWLSDGVFYTYSGFADNWELIAKMKEIKETEQLRELSKRYLTSIEWAEVEKQLSAEDFQVVEKYLPILQGDEFTWIYRSGEGEVPDTYIHAKKQTTIQGILDEWMQANEYALENVVIDSFCFADVFQTGEKNICLLTRNLGWYWMILHEENGVFYGIDMPVRWFNGVQEDGLYSGSGGGDRAYYHRMQFKDGDYIETDIGAVISGVLYINDVAQSDEAYGQWQKENITESVERFDPVE